MRRGWRRWRASALQPGKAFDMAALDPAVQAALNDTGKRAAARMSAQRPSLYSPVNGWWLPIASSDLPADALTRATMAAYAWPGSNPEEWIEASAQVDAAGKTLNGGGDYTLNFAKGQLPPVDAFWSISPVQRAKRPPQRRAQLGGSFQPRRA